MEKFGTGKWCRVLIDATVNDATVNMDFEPEAKYGGNRNPPTVRPLQKDLDLVNRRWKEYGIKD